MRRLARALPPGLLLVAVLAGWELYVTGAGVSSLVVPSPSRIAAAIAANHADLAHHALVTIMEAFLGFAHPPARTRTIRPADRRLPPTPGRPVLQPGGRRQRTSRPASVPGPPHRSPSPRLRP